jgi:hypothetical protein
VDEDRRRGVLAFLAFAMVFMVGLLGTQVYLAVQKETTGIGDGRLRPSLETPGGPYYPDPERTVGAK